MIAVSSKQVVEIIKNIYVFKAAFTLAVYVPV